MLLLGLTAGLWMGLPAAAQDADPEEIEKGWEGDVALSVSAQTGTVDTFTGTVEAGTERTFTRDHVSVRFTGAYGTSRDSKNDPADRDTKEKTIQDTQTLRGDWKRQIRERWFWQSGSVVSRDSTQDLDVRARLATGPGYRFWRGDDRPKQHFDMAAGVGYRFEQYDGNTGPSQSAGTPGDLTADNGTDSHLADLIVTFEYKNLLFDEKIEWTHTGGVAVPANDTNKYIVTTQGIAAVPLTAAWSFRTQLFYEYVNDVPDDINPSTFRILLGLGYKF